MSLCAKAKPVAPIHEGNSQRHSSQIYVPHLLRYTDQADIVAGFIALVPFMAVASLQEVDMRGATADDFCPPVAPAFSSWAHEAGWS